MAVSNCRYSIRCYATDFVDSFLVMAFFVVCLGSLATPIGKITISGPDEEQNVHQLLTPRCLVVVVTPNPAVRGRVHQGCFVQV